MDTTCHHRRRRGAYSLLEVGIVIGLIGLLSLWVLPQLGDGAQVVGDGTAQAHADLAIESALAVRRDTGAFDGDPAALEEYTVDVAVRGASVTDLAPGEVSVAVATPGQTLSAVAAAAVTDDGTCWLVNRPFGTASFDVLYGYARSGTCNADAAAGLSPVAGDTEAGTRWSRPIDATP